MSTIARARSCLLAASLVFLGGCSGGPPSLPSMRDARVGAPAAHGALLYVSDTDSGDVYVFSYPKGKLVQTLSGFTDPAGECVDASSDVFIANTGGSDVVEYAHGGTAPVATLPDSGYFPVGCAIDPVTGNLAVTNFPSGSSTQGNVVIYKHAKGKPKAAFADPTIAQMLLCAFDGAGNLFVDGLTASSASAFALLPRGAKKLQPMTLNQSIASAGGVAWDGTYLAIGDQSTNTIYQFKVKGSRGTMAGSTQLGDATTVFQFWLDGAKVIGPDAGAGNVKVWNYPAGGSPTKTIGGVYVPLGAAVSN
jgi:DNA-binding beta-propeller fold protein YncE